MPCTRQLESNRLFLAFNFELILPITCFIAFHSESFITQFAIIASILPRKFRQSNLSFGARDNMNNVLSRTKGGCHLHPFSESWLMIFQAMSVPECTWEEGVPVEKRKLQGVSVDHSLFSFYISFLSHQ